MTTIKSLKIQNFKSWEEVLLEFSSGLNVIIGASDHGKSAIVQALKQLSFNKPSGDQFLSWWGGKTLIEMILSNNDKITRIKGKGDNLYLLNGDELTAFGRNNVPNEVQNAIRLSSINFKDQADEFFLLNQTAGQVAQYINKIVNLSSIDIAQSNINKKIRRGTQKLEFHRSQKEELEIQLKKYNWIEGFEKKLTKTENLDRKVTRLQTSYHDLTSSIVDIKTAFERKRDIEKELKIKPKLDQAVNLNQQLEKLESEYDDLADLIEDIKSTKDKISEFSNLKSKKRKLKRIEILSDQTIKLESTQNKLDNLIFEMGITEKNKDELQKNLNGAKDKFNKMSPNRCPLCGQERVVPQF